MNELKVLGTEKIGNFEFTGIEGGFGKNKKSILVKDIALIHGKEVKEVNRLINNNIRRFKNGIDLLDLKQVISNHLFLDYGFTKAQWGNSNNIYLLSERGYAKLLKILEDDKAWEIYDELVDNYFNMRQSIKQYKLPQTFSEALIELAKEVKKNEVLKPKAEKYDRYLSNKGLITITEIAKEYGMSGRELNKFLHDKRIIFKKGDKWFVYQRYANDGLVGYEIYMPEDREIRRTLKWTTKGEQFIRNILEDEGIKPVLERPSQMMIEEPQEEYDGDYYTASEIAYKLYLPKGAELLIGKLANEYRLKPVFSDSNKYCRRVVDEYGRETWQYTALGAKVIEELIEKMKV